MVRALCAFLLVLSLGGASRASAQDDEGFCQESRCNGWIFFGAIAGTAALAVDSVLIGEAIDKGMRGHGLHASGASFEIFWGVAHLGAGLAIAGHATEQDLWLVGAGVPVALLGAYFIVHGALSLGNPPPPPPEPDEEDAEETADPPPEPAPSAALTLAPMEGGAMVQVFGRF